MPMPVSAMNATRTAETTARRARRRSAGATSAPPRRWGRRARADMTNAREVEWREERVERVVSADTSRDRRRRRIGASRGPRDVHATLGRPDAPSLGRVQPSSFADHLGEGEGSRGSGDYAKFSPRSSKRPNTQLNTIRIPRRGRARFAPTSVTPAWTARPPRARPRSPVPPPASRRFARASPSRRTRRRPCASNPTAGTA